VIARAGKPVARLTALQNENRLTGLGALKGKGWIADDFDAPLPDDLLAQFEGR
jgi:antitoxin (DNA-binding transcriptional repressor) of toxin-antitoxin stability system